MISLSFNFFCEDVGFFGRDTRLFHGDVGLFYSWISSTHERGQPTHIRVFDLILLVLELRVGWRRFVDRLNCCVFFGRRALYKNRSLLQTRLPAETGWRKPIGCLKLQVIFCKRATNYRALSQKMTYEDKASNDSTPPCRTLLQT